MWYGLLLRKLSTTSESMDFLWTEVSNTHGGRWWIHISRKNKLLPFYLSRVNWILYMEICLKSYRFEPLKDCFRYEPRGWRSHGHAFKCCSKSLFSRIHTHCSTPVARKAEKAYLYKMLQSSGYPINFIKQATRQPRGTITTSNELENAPTYRASHILKMPSIFKDFAVVL